MKRTVLRMLSEASREWANDPYALRKTDQGYAPTTFCEARERARAFAAWLLESGYAGGDAMAILGEGSPEWLCAELGIISAGLVSVPLSIKLLKEEISFRLLHSGAKAILATRNLLEKALSALGHSGLSGIAVIYLDQDIAWARERAAADGNTGPMIIGYEEALRRGRLALSNPAGGAAALLDGIERDTEEDSPVTISYTSGTTGNPKGIILTHLNYWTNCHDANALFDNPVRQRTLLILPVDHSFTHTVAMFTALTCGVSLYFVDARGGTMSLLRNIPQNLLDADPTFVFTVPTLSANFIKKIRAGVAERGKIAEWLFGAGLKAGIAWNGDGFSAPPLAARIRAFLPYFFAKAFIFPTVRKKAFGSSIKYFVGGGSSLDIRQQEFFAAIGIPLYQGYGLTEAAPVVSSNIPRKHKFGTVGVIAPSVRCGIVDEEGNELPPGETGEITVIGESVMKGYFRNQEATALALRGNRLWTGDLGFIDEDGFLSVVGRKNAMLIGADGEKYSPEEVEEAIHMSTSIIDQIMVWCVYRKYTCALVCLDGGEVSRLISEKALDSAHELCKALQEEFYRFRKDPQGKQIQNAWVPATFQILEKPFSDSDGTMNSTLKLVRHRIAEVYREKIEYSYSREGSTTVNPSNIAALERFFGEK